MERNLRFLHSGDVKASKGEGPALPLSHARRRELERRADEDDASPDDLIPWEQVKAQARDRFQP